jgi:hypothetical protein
MVLWFFGIQGCYYDTVDHIGFIQLQSFAFFRAVAKRIQHQGVVATAHRMAFHMVDKLAEISDGSEGHDDGDGIGPFQLESGSEAIGDILLLGCDIKDPLLGLLRNPYITSIQDLRGEGERDLCFQCNLLQSRLCHSSSLRAKSF